MSREEHIERIERGAVAGITEAVLREPIQEIRDRLVMTLVTKWRAEQLDDKTTYGLIGGIAALHDLMSHLTYEQRQGEISANMEFNSAPGE